MKNLGYRVEGKMLTVIGHNNTERAFGFDGLISEVISFPDVLVVRLEPAAGIVGNQNVYGFNENANLAWQIAPRQHVYEDSPYTGMLELNGKVKLFNWDGLELLIDPTTGKVLSEGYGK